MIGGKGLFGKSYNLEGMKLPSMEQPLPNDITLTPQAQAMRADPSFAQQPKQGMDWKNVLLQTLGGAADGAATFFGGQPLIAQGRQMQEMMAMRNADEQRRRAAELADYRTKLGIQQEFAQPEVDAFDRDMMRAGIMPGTPQYNQMAQEYAQRKVQGQDPLLQGAPAPGGGTFTGPYSKYVEMYGNGQQQTQRPARPVGGLTPITGGTSGNAGGNFPR